MKKKIKNWMNRKGTYFANLKYYTKNKKLNQRINITLLILEILFMAWAINTLYGCPCALRTCDLTKYAPDGRLMWEGKNLDCGFVQDHLAKPLDYPIIIPEALE
jgi:hypothetical protein